MSIYTAKQLGTSFVERCIQVTPFLLAQSLDQGASGLAKHVSTYINTEKLVRLHLSKLDDLTSQVRNAEVATITGSGNPEHEGLVRKAYADLSNLWLEMQKHASSLRVHIRDAAYALKTVRKHVAALCTGGGEGGGRGGGGGGGSVKDQQACSSVLHALSDLIDYATKHAPYYIDNEVAAYDDKTSWTTQAQLNTELRKNLQAIGARDDDAEAANIEPRFKAVRRLWG